MENWSKMEKANVTIWKIWFQRTGGHQDRMRTIFFPRMEGVRCHSWIRQTCWWCQGIDKFGRMVWRPWACDDWVECNEHRIQNWREISKLWFQSWSLTKVTADEEGMSFMLPTKCGRETFERLRRLHQRRPTRKEKRARPPSQRKRIGSNKWRISGRMEEDDTIWARSSQYISILRSTCCSGTSYEGWDSQWTRVRTCAEVIRKHFCVGVFFQPERWTRESLHRRSVGLVSRRGCRRYQQKSIYWIGWEFAMSQRRGENLESKSEDRDGWRIGSERRDGWTRFWRTSWWMPKLIGRLRWVCPYSKLEDGTVCNPANRVCSMKLLIERTVVVDENFEQRSILGDAILGKTLWAQISTWRSWFHFVTFFVWWCNSTCGSTLQIVTGYVNIQEDIHRGENLRWGNSLKKESTIYYVKGLVCTWNVQMMQSESSEYTRETTGFSLAVGD